LHLLVYLLKYMKMHGPGNIKSTQEVFLQHISILQQKYVCIPRSFLVIGICNQGKTLSSPCKTEIKEYLMDGM
jgi:hypothetical protein